MHEQPAPEARPRPTRKWMLAVGVLVLLAVVGVIAYVLPPDGVDDAAAPEAVIPSTPVAEPPAPEPNDAEPNGAGDTSADAEADRLERLLPPPDGACIRMDSWRPNLAEVIDCDASSPVFEVVWSGPAEAEPDVRCHFGYTYARGAGDDPHKVCLFPRFTVDECYSIPVEGAPPQPGQSMDEVADSLNDTATPLPCDAPARKPNEQVVRMLGVVDGVDPDACPTGLRYYLENGARSSLSCLAES